MTALKRFQKLESPGLWREGPDAQRRDVVLSFGEASLVISDMHDRVLTHWSLAAIDRANPGKIPAVYTPGSDSAETLEIDEPLMVEAIEAVRDAIARAEPRPGRLRLLLLGAIFAGIAGVLLLWLPGALIRHTVSVVPDEVRAEIGQHLLTRVTHMAGAPCARPGGVRALDRLTARLSPERALKVRVLPGDMPASAHLPGGIVLLNRALVEDYEDGTALAGFILAEQVRAAETDPLAALLSEAGLLATFRLLTSGHLSDEVLDAHARRLLTEPPAPVTDAALLARFAAAEVPSTPYAYARDISGESVLGLIEADPMRGKPAPPLLSDGEWLRLQGICGG